VRRVVVAACGAALLVTGVLPAAALPSKTRGRTAAHAISRGAVKKAGGDIDGDGRSDLVVGQEDGIRIYYTSADPGGSHVQNIPVPDGAVISVAVGDFNGDGFADVAVGSPFAIPDGPQGDEDGEVFVYYGSDTGLPPAHPAAFPGPAGKAHEFGDRVVALDLNHDGKADLLVGDEVDGSKLRVLYGRSGGLSTKGETTLPVGDVGGIAMGDVNGDGHPDLVVGLPDAGKFQTQDGTPIDDEGLVSVFYGTAHGISWKRHIIHGRAVGVGYGSLGADLAIAKVNGDKYADVIVGAPETTLDKRPEAGAVAVLYGSKHGLVAKHHTVLSLASKGVPGTPHSADDLGLVVVAADINGDGYADAIVGAPQQFNGRNGEVVVFRGSKRGLTGKHAQLLTVSNLGGIVTSSKDDEYGSAIVALHPRGLTFASIAIGAPDYQASNATPYDGFVDLYPGSRSGLTKHGAKRIVGKVRRESFGQALGP
jgi:hypothetical protein